MHTLFSALFRKRRPSIASLGTTIRLFPLVRPRFEVIVPDEDEVAAVLLPGERVAVKLPIDGFHASEHSVFPSSPWVVVTDQRFILLSRRGALRKRYSEDASWPLDSFTERMNSNEGTALGPFMYFLTLFTRNGETISSAFRTADQRDQFKFMVGEAIGEANGWL